MATPENPQSNTAFTINDALALLKDTNHITYLKDICEKWRTPLENPFALHLETILNDPNQWCMAFPLCLKGESSITKPKTAMNNILKHPTTISHLGEQVCSDARKTIEKAWKENKQMLINRSKTYVDKSESVQGSDHDSSQDAQDDAHHFDELYVTKEQHESSIVSLQKIIQEEKHAKGLYMQRNEKLEQELAQMKSQSDSTNKKLADLKDMMMILVKHLYPEPDNLNHIMYSRFIANF
jgi:hypothetical protein